MIKVLTIFLALSLLLTACASPPPASQPNPDSAPEQEQPAKTSKYYVKPLPLGINVTTPPASLTKFYGKLDSLPEIKSDKVAEVDLRSSDIRHLDLSNDLEALLNATFDDRTQWPELPSGFDPEQIMDLGKDPGLNIRKLHAMGVTGKGIGIAIIDQPLLTTHAEFGQRLKHYEQINYKKSGMQSISATMHGCALSSIAAGETVGVAPEADLYHIAVQFDEYINDQFISDFNWIAAAIDRVIEINDLLPPDEKIRVIAIARGWTKQEKGYSQAMDAIQRAMDKNIFVVSSSLIDSHYLFFQGLGRSVYNNPNSYESFSTGLFWTSNFWGSTYFKPNSTLLIPMDSRTTASPTGNNEYVFYREGGWSWSIPWIAGLYALACQVDPDITPQKFWETALATGDTVELERDGLTRSLGKIVNPLRLIEEIQR